MPDRDKVIRWLEHCSKQNGYECPQCPYFNGECTNDLMADAFVLLKQEAVEPINSYGTFRCGNCGNIVGYNNGNWRVYQNNFCSECGQKVKWNDNNQKD